LAYALDWRANVAIDQREYPQAEQWVEECLALTRELGDHWRLASALDTRGLLAYYQGDYAQAAQRIEEAVALCRDLRIRVGIRDFLIHLGFVCLARHNPAKAGPYFAEALRLHIEDQSQPDTAYVLEGLGMVAGERGLLAHAATLWGGAEALREAQQTRLAPADQAVFERALGAARAGLAEDKFAAAWNEGRRLATHGLDALLAYALAPEPAAPGGPKAQLPAGLTAREAEILRLLAQGLSDAALASKLVISPRTVNSHLTSIYSKLGVSSRVAATRFAVDNGLA
jgi:DNA-binding NarL/FixJ family response regulator